MNRSSLLLKAGTALVIACTPIAGQRVAQADAVPATTGRTFATNALMAPNLSTLMEAARSTGVLQILNNPGPITVFAPTNDAFGKLPVGTLQFLGSSWNKDGLIRLLENHVVAGKYDTHVLRAQIRKHDGSFQLRTVGGGLLTFTLKSHGIRITDEEGASSDMESTDLYQINGVAHIIDTVLMP